MEAKSKSTPTGSARKKSRSMKGGGGVKWRAAEGETGVQDVGWWERREYSLVCGFTPRRSKGQRQSLRVYSIDEAGFDTSWGKPGIAWLSRVVSG